MAVIAILGLFVAIIGLLSRDDSRKFLRSFLQLLGNNHQTSLIVFILITFVVSAPFFLFFPELIGLAPGDEISPATFAIPANLTLILSIYLIGLPRPQEKTILDLIPEQNLSDYFDSTDDTTIEYSKIRAKASCRYFAKFWRFSFLAMSFIYIIPVIIYFNNYDIRSLTNDFLTNFFDIISTTLFIGCLIILSRPTFTLIDKSVKLDMPKLFYFIIIVAFMLIIADFSTIRNVQFMYYKVLISFLIGLFGGLAFARFSGRIDSKFIRTPGVIIFIFYSYAFSLILFPVLHSLSATFCDKDTISQLGFEDWQLPRYFADLIQTLIAMLMLFSFVLKAFIALIIIWLFKSSRMLIYFVRMNRLQMELERNDSIAHKLLNESPELYNVHVMK